MNDADDTQTNADNSSASNGHDKSSPKRRIAVASFDGNTGTLTFSAALGGTSFVIDADKLSNIGLMAAYGAICAVQNAYANSDDPVAAAKACYDKVVNGTWTPGLPRREAQVDPLTQAIIDHLHKETGKLVTPDYINDKYVPAYQARHELGSAGAARRKLRQHGDISKRIAEIEASRAKATAAAVSKSPRESLVLDDLPA